MSEIMRFSLYKSKITKYIFGIVLASFIIPMSNAQPPQNINNFHTASWNSNGPRWFVVQTLMDLGLDVLAIQEAGSLNTINDELSSLRTSIPICYSGLDIGQSFASDLGVNEYIWTRSGGESFYIYYYNADRNNPETAESSRTRSKQSMAIISRQRADEIIIFPNHIAGLPDNYDTQPESRRENRISINRPVLGIRIDNSVFFTMHPEPRRDTRPNSNIVRNESAMLISFIESYMNSYHPTRTWMVMSDFNATPEQLGNNLPTAGNGRFIDILNTGVNTRVSGELDYAVVGGPSVNQAAINAIVASLLAMTVANPSDHKPVRFN
ncbi:Putative cytolethal distending toxin nuclease subunit CdtB [Bacteriophage APSE-7]|nr:Putative cytolethal distending toxin nuclease subunit CdtB [Bacteriophage APSE-7]